jgi:hypothetical protein
VIGPSVTVRGPLVIALRAHGAIPLQPAIGPGAVSRPTGCTTTLVELGLLPKKPA